MPEKVLITGCAGFVGRYLVDYLLPLGYDVAGTFIPVDSEENLTYLRGKIKLYKCDLTNLEEVEKLICGFCPDYIYHLAAQSHVPTSWAQPDFTLKVNVFGTLNLFSAVSRFDRKARILSVASGEVYGAIRENEVPITEETPVRPTNPYATSKLTQDLLSQQLAKAQNLDIVIVRPFSHTGPYQIPAFVCPAFAQQIAKIHIGIQEPQIKVGNLEASRDFTDVRDMVRAYHLAITKCNAGEPYNICSGKPIKIQNVLDILLSFTGHKITVIVDKTKLRLAEIPVLYGNHSKFSTATGWHPEIPLETTLRDTFNYWIETLKKQ